MPKQSLHQQKTALILLLLMLFSIPSYALVTEQPQTIKKQNFRLTTAIYPPYNYYDEQVKGLNVEIIKAAFSAVNYQVTVDILPFGRALLYAKQGKYDGVTLWHSKQRMQWFEFSQPFTQSELIFFKRKSLSVNYGNFADISPYTIGTVQKYAYPKSFTQNTQLSLAKVLTDEQNIKKLVLGRIDLALIDKRMAQFIMQKHYPKQRATFDSAGTLTNEDYYLAVSKNTDNYLEKLAAFNQGLAIIQANGTLAKITKKYDSF